MKMLGCLIIAILGAQVASPSGVRIRPATVANGSVAVTESAATDRTAHVRKFVVADEGAAEEIAGDVLVEWNPTTGSAWWTYQGLGSTGPADMALLANRFKVVFTPDKVAGFTVSQPFLGVRALPAKHYDSVDAAQAGVLAELSQTGLDASTGSRGFKLINLAAALPKDFFTINGSAQRGPDALITSASWQGGSWLLTVRSPNMAVARIRLSSDFAIKSAVVEPMVEGKTSTPSK